jgi:DNA-binding NarL/FixJ family response regulator
LCRIANILNVNPADFFEGYETLIQNPQKKHSLSHSKSNSLNILLISMSLELDYILQNLAEETDLKISTFNLANCDDIDDYARQLKHISHKIPVPDIVIYDMPAQKSNIQNFIKKIRLKPLNIEAPIIILSMLSDILIMKNAYYRGVAGYIYKNIPMSDLKDSLKYVLLYWGRGCNLLGTIS